MLWTSWWRSLFLPNKLPTKVVKTPQKPAVQPAKTEAPLASQAEPAISETFLDALIDRLEERGFVYDAPYAEVSPLPFAKEPAA